MSRSSSLFVLGLIGVLGAPAVARADDGPHDRAVVAFQEGRRFIEQGNCAAAVPRLEESLRYESSIGARLSIADCVEATDPLTAWRVLTQAASLGLMNRDERAAGAADRARALQAKLPVITFRLPAATEQPGFELHVDGDVVDRFVYRTGYATTPGKHTVEAFAPGRHFVGTVSTETGAASSIDVALRAEDCKRAEPPPAPVAAPTEPASGRRTLGLALGGAGLAGIAAGAVFGLLTVDKKRSLEAACGGNLGSCAAQNGSVDDEQRAAKTSATVSTGAFIAGGAALLGGAILYFTAPSRGASAPRTGFGVAPRVAQTGAGLGVTGVF